MYCKLAIVLVLATGVAAGAAAKLRDAMAGYTKIEVGGFRNKIGDNLSNDVVADLQGRIIAAINESKLLSAEANHDLTFPRKDPADDTKLSWEGTSAENDAKTLVLFSELITFNKGSRAKRYLIGGGTGRAELRGDCYLLEKRTGKQLFRFQSFGETNWGAFGGGADKTLKGFANRVVSFLKGKY
ncbi:MAG: DUF4410 domain-containing protein [Bryobacteraceae bacterium]